MRHQVPPVGGGIEDDVVGPSLDAAFQRRLQRLVAGVVLVEGKVIAIEQDAAFAGAQHPQQQRQAIDILAVNLDQHQAVLALAPGVDLFMHRLDQAGFSHAACTPQQRIVGGQAFGEAPCVGQQGVALVLYALSSARSTWATSGTATSLPRAPTRRRRSGRPRPSGGQPAQRLRCLGQGSPSSGYCVFAMLTP